MPPPVGLATRQKHFRLAYLLYLHRLVMNRPISAPVTSNKLLRALVRQFNIINISINLHLNQEREGFVIYIDHAYTFYTSSILWWRFHILISDIRYYTLCRRFRYQISLLYISCRGYRMDTATQYFSNRATAHTRGRRFRRHFHIFISRHAERWLRHARCCDTLRIFIMILTRFSFDFFSFLLYQYLVLS